MLHFPYHLECPYHICLGCRDYTHRQTEIDRRTDTQCYELDALFPQNMWNGYPLFKTCTYHDKRSNTGAEQREPARISKIADIRQSITHTFILQTHHLHQWINQDTSYI